MAVLKKGMGFTKKKKILKNKIETDVPNKNFFGETHEFCFTNIKTVLQKCVPNKPLVFDEKNPNKSSRVRRIYFAEQPNPDT
jgi:predicted RNase H-like HicB family nuclease